jgi:hypothetical protein
MLLALMGANDAWPAIVYWDGGGGDSAWQNPTNW